MLAQLQADFPEDLRIVYRHFPLSYHANAVMAAQGAEAAGLQDKFWEMSHRIFEQQETWSDQTPEQFKTWLEEQAVDESLNLDQFIKDMASQAVADRISADQQEGEQIQVTGTPFLFINGLRLPSELWDPSILSNLIQVMLIKDRQYTVCPTMEIDPNKTYQATLKTEKGDIVIELLPEKAPLTVNSFIFLARENWFDGVSFHRVVSDPDVAQTGDPSNSGLGGPGYNLRDEISDLKFDKPGVVGMANSGPNTNGSQFFIVRSPTPFLDGNYTIFGQVIEGLDVVEQLTPRDPTQQGTLPEGDKILDVVIEEK